MAQLAKHKVQSTKHKVLSSHQFSGDFVDRVTPVPIPNTEVKPVGADGTARETVWESRKSPGLFLRFQISNLRSQEPARAFSSRGLFSDILTSRIFAPKEQDVYSLVHAK